MVSAHVAIQVGACGPNNTIMTDWAAGAQAIGEGLRLIQSREAEVVLAGGADAGVAPLAAEAYVQAGLLPRRPNGAHSGFALAEGSTIVVLEERRRALARGARIYGELTGYCAAYGNAHLGLSSAMRGALQESEWEARTVTLVNLCAHHELSGPEGERQLLERLLPGRFESLDSRPAMGHTLAASGALDLVLLLLRLGEREPGSRALCNAMGFRGQAVTLAVERAA
jgi:3-oxoacyl-[acyl-carrier-protein] synthase II